MQREGNVEGAVPLVYKGFGLSHFAGFPPFLEELAETVRAVESQKMVPDRNFQELTAAAVIQILCLDVQREGNVEGAVPCVCNVFFLEPLCWFPPSASRAWLELPGVKKWFQIAISRS